MKKIAIRFAQLIMLLVIRIVFVGRVKVHLSEDENLSKPILIAANHVNKLDPFIIGAFVPIRYYTKISPLAFMTKNNFYYRFWRPLAFLGGLYPALPRNNQDNPENYGISKSVTLLNHGYSVLMFPEGKLIKNRHEQIKAKHGISRIMQNNKSQLLLCHIDWSSEKKWYNNRIQLSLKLAEKKVDVKNPDAIMDAIYNLPIERDHSTALENI